MKILLVTPYYAPEDFGAGVSMTELAVGLQRKGHEVEVLTLMPNYPKGEVFEAYRGKQSYDEVLDGVKVIRQLVIPAAREAGMVQKGTAAFKVLPAFMRAKPRLTKPDVIFTISPPPFAGLAARKLARSWGIPYVVRIADIAAHAIAAAKASRNPLAKAIQKLEAKMIQGAAAINAVSPSFIPDLNAIAPNGRAKEVVYDWADGQLIKPIEQNFREEWQLEDKFILMYSGSLGYTSDIGPVLKAISQMKNKEKLEFVILGAGPKLQEAKDLVTNLKLTNVVFRDLVPRSELNRSLCTAHLHVATLTPEGAKSSTQGKMRTITAAGRGVLAIMPTTCSEAKLVQNGNFGLAFDNQEIDVIQAKLEELVTNHAIANQLGDNARNFFESNFDLQLCIDQIEAQLQSVL